MCLNVLATSDMNSLNLVEVPLNLSGRGWFLISFLLVGSATICCG